MIAGVIPKRYARALMDHARERSLGVEEITGELDSLAKALKPGSELAAFLTNELIPAARKTEITEQIIRKAEPSVLIANFIRLLQKRDRLIFLPEIYSEFRRLADEFEGIIRGEVVTATDLSEKVLASLKGRLSSVMGKKVFLTVRTNPGIIGGIIVKIGSLSFDGSVLAQMNTIREKLMERVIS